MAKSKAKSKAKSEAKSEVKPAARSAADIIASYNAGREAERLALKLTAMRANVFSFYRGTAHLFWQRVVEAQIDAQAPAAWCSGDLHLENFGTYLADNGLAYFDVNDFDEAAKAPCDWEMLRLLASIAIAAPALNIGKADAKTLMHSAATAYRDALRSGKARWIERRLAVGAIGELLDTLKSRDPTRLLNRRTKIVKGARRLDVPSDRMLAISAVDRADLTKFAAALGKQFGRPDYFGLIDGARRIAGTGSLGIARYVLLVQGDGSPDGNVLIDVKAAQPSSLAAWTTVSQPAWPSEAARIAGCQQRCQAVAPHLLDAVTFRGQPYVLKELQPTADRLDLARIAGKKGALGDVVQWMGRLAAWAQLRASGRDGTATADDLIAFAGGGAALVDRWIIAAQELADVTLADYNIYCKAHDAAAASKTAKQ